MLREFSARKWVKAVLRAGSKLVHDLCEGEFDESVAWLAEFNFAVKERPPEMVVMLPCWSKLSGDVSTAVVLWADEAGMRGSYLPR